MSPLENSNLDKNLKVSERRFSLYVSIFVAFFRSGILSFGGGPSGIPLIEAEVVKKYKWLTIEEFGDMVAIANALPGPINTKLAGYVGWRVKGIGGLLVALMGTVLPTVVLLIALLSFLSAFQDQRWVRGMTHAVLPVVGVMMAQLTWKFLSNAKKGLGWTISLILCAVSFIAMELLHIHPAILIILVLLYVLLSPAKKETKEKGGNHK